MADTRALGILHKMMTSPNIQGGTRGTSSGFQHVGTLCRFDSYYILSFKGDSNLPLRTVIAAGNAILQEQFITPYQHLLNSNTNDQEPSIPIQLELPLEISKSSRNLYPSLSNTLIHSHEHAGIDG